MFVCTLALIACLAWAPFPLGSNREWSWSLLSLIVAACWIIWLPGILAAGSLGQHLRDLRIPLVLAGLTLAWALVQVLPVVPQYWVHPVWPMAQALLGNAVQGTISVNRWRTLSELTKLATYLMGGFMVFTLARDRTRAAWLLNAIIVITTAYGAYGFVLHLLGTTQFTIFYGLVPQNYLIAGPFVLHNSFATFEGLGMVAALTRLMDEASQNMVATKGLRLWALSAMKFASGKGIPFIIAIILTTSALVASASRGGFLSTCVALILTLCLFSARLQRSASRLWVLVGTIAVALMLIGLIWISGQSLNGRMTDLLSSGTTDAIRVALWSAALQMTKDAPWLGLGLGTFQDAYPIYATQMFPFIMDKAHCDYLEFLAGLGYPAALCWWGAMAWCVVRLIRGTFTRRKDRVYPLIGVGATVLVAVHSTIDFSLQIPAVSLTYAALLGIGLAQTYSTARSADKGSQ